MILRRLKGALALLAAAGVVSTCPTALGAARPAPSPWPTYHGNAARSGWAAAPPARGVRLRWISQVLDGEVYAEPLVVRGRLLVATEGDSVYALDPATGAVLWKRNLGAPMQGSALPCGDINPSGITGTPVANPATGAVYVVAFEQPGRHVLVALSASSGAIRWRRIVDPPGSQPLAQQQRAALALSGGRVYVAFGGLWGDCGDYHGWVVAVPADGRGAMLAYRVPTGREGGIWGPSGPAVDAQGNVYVATGNGSSTTTFDYGDSVIRLSPTLKPLGWFAPANWAQLNGEDMDLGTMGPLILEHGLIFQAGKEGIGYLLRAARLGGIGGQAYSAPVCSSAYGGAAYAPPLVIVPCVDGLVALRVRPDAPNFSVAWRLDGIQAGPPVVSGGAAWTIDINTGRLYAVRLSTGATLFKSGPAPVTHFAAPTAGLGMVFAPLGTQVAAWSGA